MAIPVSDSSWPEAVFLHVIGWLKWNKFQWMRCPGLWEDWCCTYQGISIAARLEKHLYINVSLAVFDFCFRELANLVALGHWLPMNTWSWRKTWRKTKYSIGVRTSHCTCFSFSFYVHLTKISKKGSGDFAAAVGFYSCPSGSSVILNHLPKRATCAAYTLAQRIILLAPGKWASISVEHW